MFRFRILITLLCLTGCLASFGQTKDPQVSFSGARKLFNNGNYKAAENALVELNRLNPDDPEILYYLGECSFFLNAPLKAVDYYNVALEKLGAETGKTGSKYDSYTRKISARITSCELLIKEASTATTGKIELPEEIKKKMARQQDSLNNPGGTPITPSTPKVIDTVAGSGNNPPVVPPVVPTVVADPALFADFKLYDGNPTTMARFKGLQPPAGWRIPNCKELTSLLRRILKARETMDPARQAAFFSDDDPIYFASSETFVYEGIRQIRCVVIEKKSVVEDKKEETEQISILFVKN